MTFEEMAAERDKLYRATMPHGNMARAILVEREAMHVLDSGGTFEKAKSLLDVRDLFLLRVAIRALRAE